MKKFEADKSKMYYKELLHIDVCGGREDMSSCWTMYFSGFQMNIPRNPQWSHWIFLSDTSFLQPPKIHAFVNATETCCVSISQNLEKKKASNLCASYVDGHSWLIQSVVSLCPALKLKCYLQLLCSSQNCNTFSSSVYKYIYIKYAFPDDALFLRRIQLCALVLQIQLQLKGRWPI